jgi:hypothetical protein
MLNDTGPAGAARYELKSTRHALGLLEPTAAATTCAAIRVKPRRTGLSPDFRPGRALLSVVR